ncbi:hypothetical protein K456DRAFT_38907 [Colletotrichum gloeosporioides 23]|nr:hypothetical protein K456DRAFT_38907 [Colletotrichum gloeosporioides 23]
MTVSCHPDETEDVVWRERTDESAPVTLCKLQEKTTLLAVASGSGRENSPGECSSDGMGWDGTDRKKRDESGKGREKKGTGKSRLQSVHAHPGRVDEDPSNVGRRDKDDSPMLVPAAGSPMEMGWHLQESAAVRVRLMLVQSRHTVHNQERPFGRPELQSAAPKSQIPTLLPPASRHHQPGPRGHNPAVPASAECCATACGQLAMQAHAPPVTSGGVDLMVSPTTRRRLLTATADSPFPCFTSIQWATLA